MYNKTKPGTTTLKRNTSYEGESIEKKVNRIVNNKEPIKDGAPLVYTDRKDGVKPEYDIRTDRWELAIDAMDKVNQDKMAKRMERAKENMDKEQKTETKNVVGDQSVQGTGEASK